MGKEEIQWTRDQPIPYQPCGSILTTLGFLPQSMSQESTDFKLFKELWALLGGIPPEQDDSQESSGVNEQNLLYMLLLIRGAKLPNREEETQPDENRVNDLGTLGRYTLIDETGKLVVLKGGQKKIFTHFKDLYVNRIQFEGLKKPVVVELDLQK